MTPRCPGCEADQPQAEGLTIRRWLNVVEPVTEWWCWDYLKGTCALTNSVYAAVQQ